MHKHKLGDIVIYDSELFRIEEIDEKYPNVCLIGNNVAFVDMVNINSQCIYFGSLARPRKD